MSVLTYNDIEEALNVDVSSPNGQTLPTSLVAAAVAYADNLVTWELIILERDGGNACLGDASECRSSRAPCDTPTDFVTLPCSTSAALRAAMR